MVKRHLLGGRKVCFMAKLYDPAQACQIIELYYVIDARSMTGGLLARIKIKK